MPIATNLLVNIDHFINGYIVSMLIWLFWLLSGKGIARYIYKRNDNSSKDKLDKFVRYLFYTGCPVGFY
ncbi:hypothetical protein BCM0079_0483 [Bacillus cereus]|uniref:hypothetical protein n=1 Tax=Bacillus cereus TaxID=1396 RepID=UPI001F202905|nr:hypothetical protein [Bacillus cereus]BCC21890.1 hypothetical protein BCM0079_0483 [Bacillus cereus]